MIFTCSSSCSLLSSFLSLILLFPFLSARHQREEDFDEEDAAIVEGQNTVDDQLCCRVAEVIGSLIKANGRGFVPVLHNIAPELLKMMVRGID